MQNIRPADQFRPNTLAVASALTILLIQGTAWAQTAPATSTGTLREVTVNSNAEKETATSAVIGYKAKNAATATKTDTPLLETPQSVTVITRDQIVDQGATNLQDALNYAAGVRSDAYGLDSRSDGVRVRGDYPDTYLNGLREAYGYYTSTTRPDPYTLERLEVLRGPSGMLFGQGTVAGVVNMVSKRPQAERQGEIGVQFGSYGRKQIQADLTGPLTQDGEWLYRLVALVRDADTQVDYVPDDRTLIAPSLTWRPSAMTSLTLQALYQKDKTGSAAQFFPWSGTISPNPNGQLPTSRFIGNLDDHYDSERKTAGWQFEHKFNDNWALRQNLRVAENTNDSLYNYANAFVASPWSGTNQSVIGRYKGNSFTKTRMVLTDQNVTGNFNTGTVKHQVLAGLDFSRQTETVAYGSSASTPIDAYNPVYTYNPTVNPRFEGPKTTQRQMGLYLQDQMKIDNWIAIAGLRHDKATTAQAGSADADSSATTMRLGLMYELAGGWAPYISYAESFTPVSPGTYGTIYKPKEGEQIEAGIKYQPADGSTLFTASVYKLKEKNQMGTSSGLPGVDAPQIGAPTKNKGLELEYKATLARAFDVIANYTYTDVDENLEAQPKNNASVWTKYRFAVGDVNGFSVGAGVRWQQAFRNTGAPEVPAVTLLDLMAAYDTTHWRYALNINNATDKVYMSTCLTRGDCWIGARRNIVASATYRF
ncbi:TonB-dependent siderophore receptor [Variovorax sp. HJSM1_2]|uniref:TonB-dependent siderophore receptor n=1 Tax=Variovorax sp. HJSM1_2 TaxID=3366263 RepID=UPI003BEB2A02